MAPLPTGTINAVELTDGTRAFHLRFRVGGERERLILHERPGCLCGCGGGWDQPAARTELGNVLARVRVGIWQRPQPPEALLQTEVAAQIPTFGEYAEWWLQAKIDGVLGDKPISENTTCDYRWRLSHLLPFFGRYRLNEIDRTLCLEFKAVKLRVAAEQREAIEAGADPRDERGRVIVPLGPASIRKLTGALDPMEARLSSV